jgi:hypothetical protein
MNKYYRIVFATDFAEEIKAAVSSTKPGFKGKKEQLMFALIKGKSEKEARKLAETLIPQVMSKSLHSVLN